MIKDQQPQLQQPIEQEYSFDKVLLPALIRANANSQYSVNLRKQYDSMNGTPEYKCKILIKRLEKFFGRDINAKINIKVGYFCARRDPNYSDSKNHPIDNQIILFGTDFMKKKQIMELYKPDQCTLIDLSHWKLIYDDYISALEALSKNQRQNVIQNKIKLQNGKIQIPKKWIQMKPYYVDSFERRVLARFATSQEKQIASLPKATISSRIFLSAKKVFEMKKKQSQIIQQNCRIRDEKYKQQRMQKRSNRVYDHQNHRNFGNFGKYQKISMKSYGQKKQRQRSRQKQENMDDKISVKSRQSKNSSFSDLVKGVNKIGLNDDDEDEFNVSFILNEDRQLQKQIQQKISSGQVIFDSQNHSISLNNIDQLLNMYNQPIQSESSVNLNQSYRLTLNMPGPQTDLQKSFEIKQFNYRDYLRQQQIEEQRRKQQQRQVIDLVDSD